MVRKQPAASILVHDIHTSTTSGVSKVPDSNGKSFTAVAKCRGQFIMDASLHSRCCSHVPLLSGLPIQPSSHLTVYQEHRPSCDKTCRIGLAHETYSSLLHLLLHLVLAALEHTRRSAFDRPPNLTLLTGRLALFPVGVPNLQSSNPPKRV